MTAPLVSDELWAEIEPLLPPEPPKPKGGRPRISNRATLTGILFVLKSGIPWEMLSAEMGYGSGMSCWRRLKAWQEAGVWDELVQVLLHRLAEANRIDWSRAALDAQSCPPPKGAPNRSQPNGPGEIGHEAPPPRRPPGPAAERDVVGGQRARRAEVGGRPRCGETRQWTGTRAAPKAPRQVARG